MKIKDAKPIYYANRKELVDQMRSHEGIHGGYFNETPQNMEENFKMNRAEKHVIQ